MNGEFTLRLHDFNSIDNDIVVAFFKFSYIQIVHNCIHAYIFAYMYLVFKQNLLLIIENCLIY